MHLQPYMTSQFGSAEVHLKHPERELLRSPQILSYADAALRHLSRLVRRHRTGTTQIKPHFDLPRRSSARFARNCVLVVRYLFNHPEALILLALLLVSRRARQLRWKPDKQGANAFWLVPLLLGVAIWGIYAMVNTEERYVTVAYLCIILTVFAVLRLPDAPSEAESPRRPCSRKPSLTASALVLLLALLAAGESLRTVLEDRRQLSIRGYPRRLVLSATMDACGRGAANDGRAVPETALPASVRLRASTIRTGRGWRACAILTEIYDPKTPVYPFLAGSAQPRPGDRGGARSGRQGPGRATSADYRVSDSDPAFRGWQQLGGTTFYALPLH